LQRNRFAEISRRQPSESTFRVLSLSGVTMCGRFTLRTPLTVLSQQFLFELGPAAGVASVRPRYNIAPTQTIAAVRRQAASPQRELAWLHWGLIPSWAKDAKLAAAMINARGETIAEKPAFRTAFARRRCLVLADGFFEWKKVGKQKQPYYLRMQDQRPFAFAGLWECWRGPAGSDGPPLESCTIVTTAANELCRPLHDRMPVILEPCDYDRWLDPAASKDDLVALLVPFPAEAMKSEPVNPRVNNARNDDPECVEVLEKLA
jgi:putative SOS response-associated peptidase YedK